MVVHGICRNWFDIVCFFNFQVKKVFIRHNVTVWVYFVLNLSRCDTCMLNFVFEIESMQN